MKRRKKIGLFTKIVVAVLSLYIAFNLVSLQIQISNKMQENASLQVEVEQRKNITGQLNAIVNDEDNSDYVADIARKYLDYTTRGERVFIDISG